MGNDPVVSMTIALDLKLADDCADDKFERRIEARTLSDT